MLNSKRIAWAIVLLVIGFFVAGTLNKEQDLRARFEKKQHDQALIFDDMWKTIEQEAQVSVEYRDSFEKIYPAIMKGRYGNARGGALMSWVQESKIDFSPALFQDLMDTIKVKRTQLLKVQQSLTLIQAEQSNLMNKLPTSAVFVVFKRQPFNLKLITSTRTEDVVKTGRDDNIDVFHKDKK